MKWVSRIEVRAEPWDGYYQSVAYRLLTPDEEPGPGVGVPLGEVAVNADIMRAAVVDGNALLQGYAFAGGERHVTRVEVSADEGETWTPAELLDDQGPWAWRLWQAALPVRRAAWRSSRARGTAPPPRSPSMPRACGTRRAT